MYIFMEGERKGYYENFGKQGVIMARDEATAKAAVEYFKAACGLLLEPVEIPTLEESAWMVEEITGDDLTWDFVEK